MRVTATRSGTWWAIEAQHDGQPIYTQAKRLDQIEALVRDAFATIDIDVSDEAIDVIPVIEGQGPSRGCLATPCIAGQIVGAVGQVVGSVGRAASGSDGRLGVHPKPYAM
ncbi:hypothetical protein BJY21_002147 [Kineosphaera limosa]|uniref:Uncharacterized protein n=1 Tax=Kineosphaera limosa NBRC 100340 TaxID=1184609 RepID=K6WWZ4_9MICO|nr:hypothetical protein [Kineosphaera limosa]NYE00963.1 hypothetical protein [Kineosphaera limosa]GAB98311.1 hypothetical protein KILIM_125_00050 [Kineosphaera limosa NBRC 100340]